MAFKQTIQAGTQQAWIAFVSNDKNIITGGSVTAPTAGATGSAGIQLTGIQTAPTGIPEGESVAVNGDDTLLGSIEFDSADPTQFVINLGQFDLDTEALLQSTVVETFADSGVSMGVMRPITPDYPDVCLLIQGKAKKQDVSVKGQKAYAGYLYPLCTIQPIGRETFEGRTAGTNRYKVTAQPTSNKAWGTTITESANGTTAATALPFTSDYPMTMHRFTGNGVLLTFTGLSKVPAGTTSAIVAIDGVQQSGNFTLSPANQTITFTSAPANGAKIVVFYQYSS